MELKHGFQYYHLQYGIITFITLNEFYPHISRVGTKNSEVVPVLTSDIRELSKTYCCPNCESLDIQSLGFYNSNTKEVSDNYIISTHCNKCNINCCPPFTIQDLIELNDLLLDQEEKLEKEFASISN